MSEDRDRTAGAIKSGRDPAPSRLVAGSTPQSELRARRRGAAAPETVRGAACAAAVTARLGLLAASLRAGGVRLGVGELLAAHRALAAVDSASRGDAYFALRAVLCARREDLEVFDAAFAACFADAGVDDGRAWRPDMPEEALMVLPRAGVPEARGVEDPVEPELAPAAASPEELLREKDFAELSEAELTLARHALAQLAARGPRRPSRRLRAVRRRGGHQRSALRPDLRRTVRASLRYGGEPLERHWRAPSQRPRPLVLVCDVSGSMAPYARMLLAYLHASVAARRRVEAFVFGTRLTRVTRELAERDPDRALVRATAAVADWSGGTRIGESLSELNRRHGRRLGRGAAVVILSDGWDRGDPDELAAEAARLRRCSHTLFWLNPLKASAEYEPLTRGMVAALPHVDHFLAGNSLASLEELARLLEGGTR